MPRLQRSRSVELYNSQAVKMITAIVVTHNSGNFVSKVVERLRAQTLRPFKICIVDCGSSDLSYLYDIPPGPDLEIAKEENVGFCRANNIAVRSRSELSEYYIFINPDAFISENWIREATEYLESDGNEGVGVVSSPLRGYDPVSDRPTGLYDSLGIERHWYGLWYDRGKGNIVENTIVARYPFEPTAICGALMLFRGSLIKQLLDENSQIFDESLFMYKDDIELSLRVRRAGWHLRILPHLVAFHCRGWNSKRDFAPIWARRLSALNDMKVALKHRSAYIIIYAVKYVYVRLLETKILAKLNGSR